MVKLVKVYRSHHQNSDPAGIIEAAYLTTRSHNLDYMFMSQMKHGYE